MTFPGDDVSRIRKQKCQISWYFTKRRLLGGKRFLWRALGTVHFKQDQQETSKMKRAKKSVVSTKDALQRAASPCRKLSDPKERKTSRLHLGRVQYMPNDLVADEPNPNAPISCYEFLSAAAAGAIRTVTKFLKDGGNIFVTDECGRTALDRSALYAQAEMTEFLLKRGARPNIPDKLGSTSLHWGCRSGNIEVVSILLNHGARVNQKDNLLTTPLQVATRVGFEEAVHLLLECGANINDQDSEGDTAVHDAVRMGKHAIVKDLIIHGANLEITNKAGKTAKDMVQTWYKETKNALEKMKAEENANKVD